MAAQSTILRTVQAQLAADATFTTLIPSNLIYVDKSAFGAGAQPRDPDSGLLYTFVVITNPAEAGLVNMLQRDYYVYYYNLFFYNDAQSDYAPLTAAAQAAKAALHLKSLPDSDEAFTWNQQSVRMPGGGTGSEVSFVANRLTEHYRILIQRKLRSKAMYYIVTHNDKPARPRQIGDFYEWGPANDWTQFMDVADAQVFMSTSASRELTFVAVDDEGHPLPAGYPLAPNAIVPAGALVVLRPSLTGPIRTVIYPDQLQATPTKELPTMSTNVIHKDHPGGVDYERELGGYVWSKANNWTVEMLDSHAQILQDTPEAGEFKFQPIDPNAAADKATEARSSFATLKPGKETVTEAPTSRLQPAQAGGEAINA